VQKSILDDVLDISGVIRKNTEASNEIVQRLGESSNIVNSAVEQITASTQVIAESIEHQTVMTQSIQQSINDTVKHSKEVVQFANNSTVTIDSSLQVMENLRLQSTTIVSANEDVVIGGVI
jgi:methyl-accepting chemotaxis protein